MSRHDVTADTLLQNSFPVNHCRDYDLIFLQTIDDSVAVDDQFTDVLIVEFGDFTPGTWKPRQGFHLVHDLLSDNSGIGGRIGGYVLGDSLEILKSTPGPSYSVSHLLRRVSTSS